jgi:hypothetical protein
MQSGIAEIDLQARLRGGIAVQNGVNVFAD